MQHRRNSPLVRSEQCPTEVLPRGAGLGDAAVVS